MEKAGFQMVKNPADNTKWIRSINRQPISDWFKEQFDKLHRMVRQQVQPQKKSEGLKL